jgi:hypothetical protein
MSQVATETKVNAEELLLFNPGKNHIKDAAAIAKRNLLIAG